MGHQGRPFDGATQMPQVQKGRMLKQVPSPRRQTPPPASRLPGGAHTPAAGAGRTPAPSAGVPISTGAPHPAVRYPGDPSVSTRIIAYPALPEENAVPLPPTSALQL